MKSLIEKVKKKRGRPPKKKTEKSRLIVDEYTEEPLSTLLSKIREAVKRYRGVRMETVVKEGEDVGNVKEVEIKVRIQIS